MKLNRLFMLGLAGLAFAACSSDDEATSALDGDAVVRVNIVTAGSTRSLADQVTGTDDATQAVVVNEVTLKLTAGTGSHTETFTTDETKGSAIDQAKAFTFTKVRNPQKMEIFINQGTEKMVLKDVINTKLAAPMYAYADASNFKLVEPGAGNNYQQKTYEVTLNPQHKTALLEFSGIKHKPHNPSNDPCAFKTMTLKGIFMNKVAENENDLSVITSWNSWDLVKATGTDYVWDEIANGTDFLSSTEGWPKEAANKCYAYNVFGNTDVLPIMTLYFDGISTNPGFNFFNGATTGYASVAKYKLSVESLSETTRTELGVTIDDPYVKKFIPGYVYRIKNIEVPDSAIGPTPDGGENVNVVVVEVEVKAWRLVSGTVEWN